MKLLRKLRALFRKGKLDAEMSEEMRAHLELQAVENMKRGMSADEARYAAQRSFGGVEQIKERARDQRGWRGLEEVAQDVRYGVRGLGKAPGFTIAVVLTLAFGIGVNAALFTVYNAATQTSLPVRNPGELVTITGRNEQHPGGSIGVSYLDYLDYRDQNRALAGLAVWREERFELDDQTADEAGFAPGVRVARIRLVSDNYLSLLGARMILGRDFLPEENRTPRSHPVMVVSHLFWEQHLHSDAEVVGETIALSGVTYTVIGVTAPGFVGHSTLPPPSGWIPLMMRPEGLDHREVGSLPGLIGRLKPGVSERQAKADLDLLTQRLAGLYPGAGRADSVKLERGLRLTPLTLRDFAPLSLGFVMVLVISCANVANLLLARGLTRQREIGVRLTLGASRGRVIRQLLTEYLLLATVGGVVGLALAGWTLQILETALIGILPGEMRPALTQLFGFAQFGPDLRVVAFTFLAVVASALTAGLAPALHASRTDLISAVKGAGSVFGGLGSASRLRNLLVVVQLAICLTLLSCAGLFVRNMLALRRLDLGYDPDRVFNVALTAEANRGRLSAGLHHAIETVRALPGVIAATAFRGSPMIGAFKVSVAAPGAGGNGPARWTLRAGQVDEGFFATIGISLREGRAFGAHEMSADARLVVLSETAARRFFPGGAALGKSISVDERGLRAAPATPDAAGARGIRDYEVIGVVRNVRAAVDDPEDAFAYFPLPPEAEGLNGVFVRPRADTDASLVAIRGEAAAAGAPLQFRSRLSVLVQWQSIMFSSLAWLSGTLGALALAMAALGLYGMMAFSVNQRTREIGIRTALGATAGKIVRHFLWQGGRLVAGGVACGLAGGALFALVLSKFKFGLGDAFDPLVFGAIALLLSVIAMFACWLPARRAAKVDPMVALRCE